MSDIPTTLQFLQLVYWGLIIFLVSFVACFIIGSIIGIGERKIYYDTQCLDCGWRGERADVITCSLDAIDFDPGFDLFCPECESQNLKLVDDYA